MKLSEIATTIFVITTLIFSLRVSSLLSTKIKNDAIDGCAKNTFYQMKFTDSENRIVTVQEPQKLLYQECLLQKDITR